MFNIGDLVIYSAHGICKVEDICERTISGTTRSYYILRPIDNDQNLTIGTPVENENTVIFEIIDKNEAMDVLELFKNPEIDWIEKPNIRHQTFSQAIKTGDRKEIANIVNTLMRKNIELEQDEKKLYEQDRKLLQTVKSTLYKELAISMDTSYENIEQMVKIRINENKKIS